MHSASGGPQVGYERRGSLLSQVLNNTPLSYPADLWALGSVVFQVHRVEAFLYFIYVLIP